MWFHPITIGFFIILAFHPLGEEPRHRKTAEMPMNIERN